MVNATPLVSIGLPVFNGEVHLGEAIESLLGQTLGDFELIIADNASTDGTRGICEGFAHRDPRVRYVRQTRNIGAPANWNFVARQARGRFFKWASASDRCAPTLLERCVGTLQADESAALCFGHTEYIDELGQPLELPTNYVEALADRPSDRFIHVCRNLARNDEQYGVIRTAALHRTKLERPYPHGDLVLMAELGLQGKFVQLPDTLLVRRMEAENWTGRMSTAKFESLFWPDSTPRFRAPAFRFHWDYLVAAISAPVAWPERLRAAAFTVRYAYWRRRNLRRDLATMAAYLAGAR
jgi:glycosyltransferase involved in cell wall biosynthesis